MSTLPKLCLNMIVKNESHIIQDKLDKLLKKIKFDYYVICDTGSTDNTKQIIKSLFDIHNLDGEIFDHEWSDFGTNRTKALQSAYGKSEYIFIFDADDEIQGEIIIPNDMCYDKYNLKIGKSFTYYRPLLLNNKKKWHFVGVLHEYLSTHEKNITETLLDGNYYIDSCRDGNRNKDNDKYINDAKILEEAYKNTKDTNAQLANRYAFYCAQSYKDAGDKYRDLAITWYSKILGLSSWIQEKYYSCLMLGDLYEDNFKKLEYYMKSLEYDPERTEGMVFACKLASKNGIHYLVNMLYHTYKNIKQPEGEKLFVFSNLYNDHLAFYASISNYYLRNQQLAYEISKTIIKNNILDNHMLDQVYRNLLFYKSYIENESSLELFQQTNQLLHNKHLRNENIDATLNELWNYLYSLNRNQFTKPCKYSFANNNNNPKLVITFTTCKRLDLFQQTVRSFVHHLEDVNSIDYWFCVDDNSSIVDREKMKTEFHWIDYYMKDTNEKGHRQSMNIIYDKLVQLNPTYWLHLEDDFLFINNVNIQDMIQKLDVLDVVNAKQILFNINYAETIQDYSIKGSLSTNVKNVAVHNHKKGAFPYKNCHYWPHYSFRPSIVKFDAIKEIGNFDTENPFFEMDYANKYTNKGFTSIFLNEIKHIHIGRLTSERNTSCKNAYELNNEEQFDNVDPPIKIINLEKRTDRKEKMIEQLTKCHIHNYEFIKAVNGNELNSTLQLASLFHNNDFGNRKGVIGCALSHYNLWKKLLHDKDNEFYVIFEDDIHFDMNMYERFYSLKNSMPMQEFMFLGYSMFENKRREVENIYKNEKNTIEIKPLNKDLYIGGYFGYSINKAGAQKMINYIEHNGIKHGIDYLNIVMKELNSVECVPQLMFSEWNENGKTIDSNIQNIYEGFDFTKYSQDRIDDEDYVYIDQMDQFDYDININRGDFVRKKCEIMKNDAIAGFNSLGFTKSNIFYLQRSPYFKQDDGIYIKRSQIKNLGYDILHPPVNMDKIASAYDTGVFCFIHSCYVNSIGLTILDRLLNKLKEYGKIEVYKKIFIINIGEQLDVNTYSQYDNVVIIQYSNNIKLYELKTINLIYYFSLLNPHSKVLYIHTKGVLRENSEYIQNWVDEMLYFLVKRHDSCVKHLDTVDVVGCNYISSPTIKPHFSGNYWMANTNYIKTLEPIKTTIRHEAEWWILTNPEHTMKCLHHSSVNHYKELYPKNRYETIRIKMLCNWCTSRDLCNEWNNMCEKDYTWKNIEMTWENTDIDYYVIINYPCTTDYYDKKKTIVFQMEPWVNDKHKNWGVKTWGIWADPNPDDFFKVIGRNSNTYNNVFWQFKLELNELMNVKYEKKNILSCVTSNKYFDEGHIARIEFLKFLEKKGDVNLHIFGNVEGLNFKSHQHQLQPLDKHSGIVPYKYYFMVENNYEKDFITEKLWEPILCESLTFYYGCPNVDDYIDTNAYVQLDMNDFEKSYQIIKQAIEEDWWSQRIDSIKKCKNKLLNEMAFLPRLQSIISKNNEYIST